MVSGAYQHSCVLNFLPSPGTFVQKARTFFVPKFVRDPIGKGKLSWIGNVIAQYLPLFEKAAWLTLAACGSSASTDAVSDVGNGGDAGNVVCRTLDEIKANATINIGVFSDKNPFGYVDENGEYQGYDIYSATVWPRNSA